MGKVRRREWTQEEIEEAKRLYAEGLNFTQIGVEIGRSKGAVRYKLVALKIHEVEKKETVYLWSIESIRGHIIDEQEAKKTTHKSGNKLLFKCSTIDCDNTKMMFVSNLVNYGYSCPTCSTGTSYGQLAFQSYQAHFKLGYEAEKVLPTLDDRRADFVKFDENENVLNFVEIQGVQHTDVNHIWYEDAYEQDIAKRKWSKATNTLMIEIDMRVSSWGYFKEQINKCEYLPSINDEDEIAILELMELNKRYPVKEIIEMYLRARKTTYQIAEHYGYSVGTINNILTRNNVDLRDAKASKGKMVRCIETGEVYQSSVEASRTLGINRSNISSVCRGKLKSAGGFHFEYLSDIESNAHHRSQYKHDNSETDTIELDDSIDLSEMLNYKNNTQILN